MLAPQWLASEAAWVLFLSLLSPEDTLVDGRRVG